MAFARTEVQAFVGHKHPAVLNGKAQRGDLLIHLWFTARHSLEMDLEIFAQRMEKGEVSHIVIFSGSLSKKLDTPKQIREEIRNGKQL